MFVITPMSGRAICAERGDLPQPAHAHLRDRAPRCPARARVSVSGRPISLLCPSSAATRSRHRPAERREDVLRRGLPARARDRDDARVAPLAHRAAERRHRGEVVVAGRASPPRRARAPPRGTPTPPPSATNRSPGPTRRESICTPVTCRPSRFELAELERAQLVAAQRDHVARPQRSQRVARRLAVVERESCDRRTPGPARHPCRRSARRRPRAPARSRARSRPRGRLDVDVADDAGDDLVDDRLRILAARVVGGDDRDVGELGRESSPSAAACRGRGRRRRRPRRSRRPPGASSRAALQHVLERARLVGVVDDHRERLPFVDRLRIVRARRAPTRCRARSRRRRCRAAAPAANAPSAFSTLKRPRSLTSIPASTRGRSPRRRANPNVSASGSSAASRRPYSSPTFTAARGLPRRTAAASPGSTTPCRRGSRGDPG